MKHESDYVLARRLKQHKRPLRDKTDHERKRERELRNMRALGKDHLKRAQEQFKDAPTKQKTLDGDVIE